MSSYLDLFTTLKTMILTIGANWTNLYLLKESQNNFETLTSQIEILCAKKEL